MAAESGEHAPAQGRGKGRVWNIAEEDVDVQDFTKGALAFKNLRLGALTSSVKNVVCAHNALGCNYVERIVKE